MKHALLTIPVLALTACGTMKTPESRYFATLEATTAAVEVANGYLAECLKQPKGDPCYGKRAYVRDAVTAVEKAKAQADQVFISHDSDYYDLSLTVVENAVKHLNTLSKE